MFRLFKRKNVKEQSGYLFGAVEAFFVGAFNFENILIKSECFYPSTKVPELTGVVAENLSKKKKK